MKRLQNDPMNCGACGKTCAGPPARGRAACQAGSCTVQCEDDYLRREGQCVTAVLLEAARAAGFGSMPPCAALAAYQSALFCQGQGQGLRYCGTRCVNVAISREHGGSCNRACAEGEVCVAGSCF